MAEKCGHPIDEKAWKNSFSEVSKSLDRKTGALGYSSRAPWSPDISARTGAMATALMVAGRDKNFATLAESLVRFNGRMRHSHVLNRVDLRVFRNQARFSKEVFRGDGNLDSLPRTFPFAPRGSRFFRGKRNIGGDQYLGLPSIGNASVGMILASAENRLFMHGGTRKGWFGKAN